MEVQTSASERVTSFRDVEFGYLEVMMAAFSLLACLVTIFYLIPNWIMEYSQSWPTPRTFPYTTCTIHALLCTIWLVNSLFGRNIKALSNEIIKMGITLNAIVMALCAVIYYLGYISGGILAVTAIIILVKGPRYWKQAIVAAVCISVGYYGFFKYLMNVGLPDGIFI